MSRVAMDVVERFSTTGAGKVVADTRKIADAKQKATRTGGDLVGMLGKVSGALAGLGLLEAGRRVLMVGGQFEQFRAQVGGAFAGIQKFAAETPFTVDQVTTAFIQLRNLGIEPTERRLKAFGNVAAGTVGKSLRDFTEAVADAATGEFERLKEFGVKASQQGDQVALTFRGVTKTIQKDSASIVGYLTSLGEVEFADEMDKKAKTLLGRISTLKDAFQQLQDAVFNAGLGQEAKAVVEFLITALNTLREAFPALKSAALSTVADIIEAFGKWNAQLLRLKAAIAEFVADSVGLFDRLLEFQQKLPFANDTLIQGTRDAAIAIKDVAQAIADQYTKEAAAGTEGTNLYVESLRDLADEALAARGAEIGLGDATARAAEMAAMAARATAEEEQELRKLQKALEGIGMIDPQKGVPELLRRISTDAEDAEEALRRLQQQMAGLGPLDPSKAGVPESIKFTVEMENEALIDVEERLIEALFNTANVLDQLSGVFAQVGGKIGNALSQATGLAGAVAGAIPGIRGGGFGAVGGVLDIAGTVYGIVQGILDDRDAREDSLPVTLDPFGRGPRGGSSAIGGAGLEPGAALDILRELQRAYEGWQAVLGGMATDIAALGISVQRDGQEFTLELDGVIHGVFDTMGDAMEAGWQTVLRTGVFEGIGEELQTVLSRISGGTELEALRQLIPTIRQIDRLASGASEHQAAFQQLAVDLELLSAKLRAAGVSTAGVIRLRTEEFNATARLISQGLEGFIPGMDRQVAAYQELVVQAEAYAEAAAVEAARQEELRQGSQAAADEAERLEGILGGLGGAAHDAEDGTGSLTDGVIRYGEAVEGLQEAIDPALIEAAGAALQRSLETDFLSGLLRVIDQYGSAFEGQEALRAQLREIQFVTEIEQLRIQLQMMEELGRISAAVLEGYESALDTIEGAGPGTGTTGRTGGGGRRQAREDIREAFDALTSGLTGAAAEIADFRARIAALIADNARLNELRADEIQALRDLAQAESERIAQASVLEAQLSLLRQLPETEETMERIAALERVIWEIRMAQLTAEAQAMVAMGVISQSTFGDLVDLIDEVRESFGRVERPALDAADAVRRAAEAWEDLVDRLGRGLADLKPEALDIGSVLGQIASGLSQLGIDADPELLHALAVAEMRLTQIRLLEALATKGLADELLGLGVNLGEILELIAGWEPPPFVPDAADPRFPGYVPGFSGKQPTGGGTTGGGDGALPGLLDRLADMLRAGELADMDPFARQMAQIADKWADLIKALEKEGATREDILRAEAGLAADLARAQAEQDQRIADVFGTLADQARGIRQPRGTIAGVTGSRNAFEAARDAYREDPSLANARVLAAAGGEFLSQGQGFGYAATQEALKAVEEFLTLDADQPTVADFVEEVKAGAMTFRVALDDTDRAREDRRDAVMQVEFQQRHDDARQLRSSVDLMAGNVAAYHADVQRQLELAQQGK